MFIGRKEFIDKVNDLEGKLNNQKIVNDMLMKKIADLTEKLDSVQSIMALNAIEKLMTAVAKERVQKEKTTKKVKTQKGSKKKPCSK